MAGPRTKVLGLNDQDWRQSKLEELLLGRKAALVVTGFSNARLVDSSHTDQLKADDRLRMMSFSVTAKPDRSKQDHHWTHHLCLVFH